ncbi:aldo/keto reductase [Streptomyces sp. NBC_01435]|uniref:aldo/keto reductase n=1 Tax=Streptomyces sp. NBC_01435 TaxID=2903865 RepID=UPI002E2EEFCE|nr:aldo/keto reductase [Streptomyces sp. NBC_01435]
MRYTRLGRTALKISRLCVGTVNFGGRVDEEDGHRILNRALDLGLNFVDTANMYGWRVHKGYTEETIGRWFAKDPARRDRTVLATKVGNEMSGAPNDSGLSARHIVASCEASLRRLQTDRIDLFQLHHVDRTAPWDEIWQALDLLVSQGKVLYVGSSNFAGWHVAMAQEAAGRRHFLGLVSEQCAYNLVTRLPELELIPAARAYGMAVLPWSPLHGGLLGGVLAKLHEGTAVKSAQGRAVPALEEHHDRIAAYEELCRELGEHPAQVGLAWVLSRPGVTAPVIGPRSVEQLDGAVAALDLTLPHEVLTRLDELFPGPRAEAPEAWITT